MSRSFYVYFIHNEWIDKLNEKLGTQFNVTWCGLGVMSFLLSPSVCFADSVALLCGRAFDAEVNAKMGVSIGWLKYGGVAQAPGSPEYTL